MPLSSFLAGLARTAGTAAPFVANAMSAKLQAQREADAEQRRELIQLLALERQDRTQAVAELLARKRAANLDARTDAARRVPLTYKTGDGGEIFGLPKSVAPAQVPSGPTQGDAEASRSRQNGRPSADDLLGIATGVHAPPPRQPAPRSATGMVGGHAVLGTVAPSGLFSPDTTATGDTVFAVPRAGRTGGSRSASDPRDVQLNHTINNVRAQLAEAERQAHALDRTIQTGTGVLATDEAKKAAAVARLVQQKLQARADSLRAVHDQLIERQQSRLGGVVDAAPGRGAANLLTPQQNTSMQSEFDAASRDLQTLLSSNAPPEVKAEARRLYDAHQAEVARKYGANRSPRP